MPYLSSQADPASPTRVLYLGTEGVELDETNPENRFSPGWIAGVNAQLDELAGVTGPAALVLSATGKFFSNGLDVGHIAADPGNLPAYLDDVHALFARVLTLPMPVVAAVNGHAFGAGAMLAVCADVVVMRADRGFWSLPEVHLGMPFTRGMASLIRARLGATAAEAMFTGRRYGGVDAVAGGFAVEAPAADALVSRATEIAAERAGTSGAALAQIKRDLWRPLLDDLAFKTPPAL